MADIDINVEKIRAAILGEEVRESIASGIEGINEEVESTTAKQDNLKVIFDDLVINAGDENAEIVAARNGKGSLPIRLAENDADLANFKAETLSSLEEKANQIALDTTNNNVTTKADKVYVDEQIALKASGTPDETFSTLTTLQTAYPVGNSRNKLISANGHIYTWSGSAWTDTGILYQATGVADGGITPIKNANSLIQIIPTVKDLVISPSTIQGTSTSIIVTFKASMTLIDTNKQYMSGSADFSITVANGEYLVLTWTTGSGTLTLDKFQTVARASLVPAYNKYVLLYNANGRLYSPMTEFASFLAKSYGTNLKADNVITSNILNGAVTKDKIGFGVADLIPTKNLPTINPQAFSNVSTPIDIIFPVGHLLLDTNKENMNSSAEFTVNIPNGNYLVLTWEAGTGKLDATTVTAMPIADFVPANNKYILFYNGNGRLYSPISAYASWLNNLYYGQGNSYGNIIIVAKSGGDFDDLQAGINASTGTRENPATIWLMPGVYEGSFDARGKFVSIVGVNKQDCIIINHSGNYLTPPLYICAPCYLAKLTVIATHEDSIETDKALWKSYAVHADDNTFGTYEFFDCKFESYCMASIGNGLGQDQTLILRSCEILSHADIDSPWVNHGALYSHNDLQVTTNQKLIVDNCRIISDNGQAMYISDAGTVGSIMDVEFTNNMLYSNTLGKTNIVRKTTPVTSGKFSGASITLNAKSYGNNIAELNV